MSQITKYNGYTEEKIFEWLDKTQESGLYNMITEIAQPLRTQFGLDSKQAIDVWARWTDTYEERHPE